MISVKVYIFVGGLDATFNARILPLARALTSYGVECKVIPPINWQSIVKDKLGNVLSLALTHDPNEYVKTLTNPPDIAIFGRVSTPQMYLLQKILKNKGVKAIFDLDDALFLPTSKLFGVNVRSASLCLEKIVKNSDYVIVSGHYLLSYVRPFNEKAAIIHDPVDTELFLPKSRVNPNEKITIGWEGAPRSHYENLAILIDPLMRLSKEYDLRFKIVSYLGDLRVKEMFSRLEKLMEIDYGLEQWVPMGKFAELLYDFDIMVAPLQKTPWYEGKSASRVGIGMAMGIPVVASSVGEQKYVIRRVNGFLARDEEEWYTYLKRLIENDELRKSMGEAGRKTAEKELSLKVNGRKLYRIIEELAK